ncbi:MAG: alpha/beta fold hydrolase [Hyphomicrobiaceae bacterium]
MARVTIDGVEIETRLLPGDPEAPWLVFLHEGLGSVSLWRDFPDKVARRLGSRALVYSRQGYGQSAPLAGPRQPDFMHREALDVLPKLLAHFSIEQPVLIGHSDGASIALIHAADAGRPTRGVVLMAPHVLVEAISQQSIARITEIYETTDLRQRLSRHHAHVDDAFLGWARIWLDPRFRTWSLGAEAGRLHCPALLIQGSDDEYGTLAQLDAIAEVMPGPVDRWVLDKCGHAPHREHETAVIDRIAAFAAGLNRADA